ncbi:MAG TPA: polyribonucleotide nucleotidyltransferase, partial [Myxococcota bacterium]|nr:polyribonucleotide nucleotidyltransferase [Myxococcota bacterium]
MASYWFDSTSVTFDVGGRTVTLETGRMAKQAAGAVVVSCGETVVLVTATRAKPREGIDFFPLVVDYVEKFSAAGKIPGGFFKREGRLSDREVLVSRFIDRSIRPLFPESYRDETQIIATVLSADGENPPDLCAFVGASAALSLSEMPFLGPISAVRLGRIEGEFVLNPAPGDFAKSDLELVVAGSAQALVMVEGSAKELPEAQMLAALELAHRALRPAIEAQQELVRRVGKPKLAVAAPEDRKSLEAEVRQRAESRLAEAVRIREKEARYTAIAAVEKEVVDALVSAYRDERVSFDSLEALEARRAGAAKLTGQLKELLHELRYDLVRARILDE